MKKIRLLFIIGFFTLMLSSCEDQSIRPADRADTMSPDTDDPPPPKPRNDGG